MPLGDGFKLTLEQIARTSDRAAGSTRPNSAGCLSYKVAPNVEFGFGYRKVGSHNGVGDTEDRIRQQVVATFGPIVTRFRVDERFNPNGDEIGFRIRPLVRYNYKLGTKGFGLFASHESFILPNSTSWGQRAGWDRMRNAVGVTLPLGKRVSSDIGYLNQYKFGRGGARAQMDHALTLQLTINLQPGHHDQPPGRLRLLCGRSAPVTGVALVSPVASISIASRRQVEFDDLRDRAARRPVAMRRRRQAACVGADYVQPQRPDRRAAPPTAIR